MKYILADKDKALKAGFSAATHYAVKKKLVLTEKELAMTPHLTGEFAERLNAVGGRLVSLKELNNIKGQK